MQNNPKGKFSTRETVNKKWIKLQNKNANVLDVTDLAHMYIIRRIYAGYFMIILTLSRILSGLDSLIYNFMYFIILSILCLSQRRLTFHTTFSSLLPDSVLSKHFHFRLSCRVSAANFNFGSCVSYKIFLWKIKSHISSCSIISRLWREVFIANLFLLS